MAQKYIEYTKIIKKAGIKINGRFIFGFDSDNLKTLFQLWKFLFFHYAAVYRCFHSDAYCRVPGCIRIC